MTDRRSYARDQSRLYRIKSPAQLADIFFLKPYEVGLLLAAKENYVRWTDKKTGREIQRPKPLLGSRLITNSR